MTSFHTNRPKVGEGATIVLFTDTQAAVVTRVTATRVFVRPVETGETRVENPSEVAAGGLPVDLADGILDRPKGPEQGFRIRDNGRHGPTARGEVYIRVGKSIARRDWRH